MKNIGSLFYWRLYESSFIADLSFLKMNPAKYRKSKCDKDVFDKARYEYPYQTKEVKDVLDRIFVLEKKINQFLGLKAFW